MNIKMNTQTKLGLDLTEYFEDISKIIKSKFPVQGSDADDLIQNVCKKLVKLNKSAPYDPTRSSVSHYVYMVASSVFKSGLRKEKRSPLKNAVSFQNYLDIRDIKEKEVQEGSLLDFGGYISEFVDYVEQSLELEDTTPRRILLLTSMGYTKKEISKILDISFYKVDKDRNRLKEMAQQWAKFQSN